MGMGHLMIAVSEGITAHSAARSSEVSIMNCRANARIAATGIVPYAILRQPWA